MRELTITSGNFQEEILNSKEPVLVDFWAAWCGPCKMLSPIIAEIAEEYAGKLKVGKINVDEQAELAQAFHIASIPTMLVFKNGKIVNQAVGYYPKNQIAEMLDAELK